MKLYATTTSERASKGQGGGYLDIDIKNQFKELVATIKIRAYENAHGYDSRRVITIWHNGLTEVKSYKADTSEMIEEKGKKKDAEILNDETMKELTGETDKEYNERLSKQEKGKKQKGDILNESSDIHEGQHKNCSLCELWLDKTE